MLCENNIRIAIDDNGSQEAFDELLKVLPKVIDIIDDKLNAQQTVIVHCLAGRQRSAAVVAAYLMAKYSYSLDYAIEYIKCKKIDAFFPTANFAWSLQEYEKMIKEMANLSAKNVAEIVVATRRTWNIPRV